MIWKANYFKSLEMASRHGTCAVVQIRAVHCGEPRNVTFSVWSGARCIARGPCAQTEDVGAKPGDLKTRLVEGDKAGQHLFLRRQLENSAKGGEISFKIEIEDTQ